MRINLFIVLAVSLFIVSCEKEPIPQQIIPQYFERVTNSQILSTRQLVDKIAPSIGISGAEIDELLKDIPQGLKVKVDAIEYKTKDPFGNDVIASGIVTYSGNLLIPTRGLIVAQHAYNVSDQASPSRLMMSFESAAALAGYIVVSADYLGYGASVDTVHPCFHVENTGQVTVDMLLAAREHFALMNRKMPAECTVIGYSQGASAALAFQKKAEEKYASKIAIKEILAGGGVYDIEMIFNDVLQKEKYPAIHLIACFMLGMDYAYSMDLDFAKTFKDTLFEHYKEMILSKKYSSDEILNKLGTTNVKALFAPELFDPENSNTKKIQSAFSKNDLTVGWKPKAPITLWHAEQDEYINIKNCRKAYESFNDQGCNITKIEHNGPEGHVYAAVEFYKFVIGKLL